MKDESFLPLCPYFPFSKDDRDKVYVLTFYF
jgi:hypothetical protein